MAHVAIGQQAAVLWGLIYEGMQKSKQHEPQEGMQRSSRQERQRIVRRTVDRDALMAAMLREEPKSPQAWLQDEYKLCQFGQAPAGGWPANPQDVVPSTMGVAMIQIPKELTIRKGGHTWYCVETVLINGLIVRAMRRFTQFEQMLELLLAGGKNNRLLHGAPFPTKTVFVSKTIRRRKFCDLLNRLIEIAEYCPEMGAEPAASCRRRLILGNFLMIPAFGLCPFRVPHPWHTEWDSLPGWNQIPHAPRFAEVRADLSEMKTTLLSNSQTDAQKDAVNSFFASLEHFQNNPFEVGYKPWGLNELCFYSLAERNYFNSGIIWPNAGTHTSPTVADVGHIWALPRPRPESA